MTTASSAKAVLPCAACGKLNRVDLARAEAKPKCGTCQARLVHDAPFAPFAMQQRGQAIVAKVDTDRNPGIATRFAIRNIPTIAMLKDGKEVARQVGAVPMDQLEQMVISAR